MRTATRWLLVLLAGLVVSAAAPARSDGDGDYIVGVAPQFDQRKLFATWRPVLDALERRTAVKFRFESVSSVSDFEKNIARGAYDFVYLNPYHLYRERNRQGYIPLVRDTSPLKGIVVVPRDSPVREFKDLDGRTLAVPSSNAIGASLLIRAELERTHGVRMQIVDARSHTSAYLYAVNQLADAAGGVTKTLAEQTPEVRRALRTVFVTGDFPSHPVAAHPRVPAALREQVRQALLAISADPQERRILEEIPMAQAVRASFGDYQALQRLALDAYWVEPEAGPAPAGKP